jgi:hypothetical protein
MAHAEIQCGTLLDNEENEDIFRQHEGEASFYYSQSASVFEDDQDNDFVSTAGRRGAIFKSSAGFLRLHHHHHPVDAHAGKMCANADTPLTGALCAERSHARFPNYLRSPPKSNIILGLLKAKAQSSVVMLRLLSQAKASVLDSFADAESGSSSSDDGGSDNEDDCPTTGTRFELERRTSSMRRSIQNFDEKLEFVEKLVVRGEVVSEHSKHARPVIEKQGNLNMYEHDQLLLRTTIKRSPPFREMVMRLWEHLLAAEQVEQFGSRFGMI